MGTREVGVKSCYWRSGINELIEKLNDHEYYSNPFGLINGIRIPYYIYIVGDGGYDLSKFLMTPIEKRRGFEPPAYCCVYNYKQSCTL